MQSVEPVSFVGGPGDVMFLHPATAGLARTVASHVARRTSHAASYLIR